METSVISQFKRAICLIALVVVSFFLGSNCFEPFLFRPKQPRSASYIAPTGDARLEFVEQRFEQRSDLLSRVSKFEEIPDLGRRVMARNRLVKSLSNDDCRELLTSTGVHINSDLQLCLVARWMETDPAGAMSLDRNSYNSYIDLFTRKSSSAATEWVRQCISESGLDKTAELVSGLLKGLARKDPILARNVAAQLDPENPIGDTIGSFVAARGTDYALNWLKESDNRVLTNRYGRIFYELAQYEPAQLLARLEEPDNYALLGINYNWLRFCVIPAGMAVRDPGRANDYIKSLPQELDPIVVNEIVEIIYFNGGSDNAVQWILSLPRNADYDAAKLKFVDRQYSSGNWENCLEVTLTVQGPERSKNFYKIFDRWRFNKPEYAASWMKRHSSKVPPRTDPPLRDFYGH